MSTLCVAHVCKNHLLRALRSPDAAQHDDSALPAAGCSHWPASDPAAPTPQSIPPGASTLAIAPEDAVIEDNAQEMINVLAHRQIRHIAYLGVHENMCIMHRSQAIEATLSWGYDVALIRGLARGLVGARQHQHLSDPRSEASVVYKNKNHEEEVALRLKFESKLN